MPDPRFIGLVHSLRSSAEAALGDLASPMVTRLARDGALARSTATRSLGLLDLLFEKTRGNLDATEREALVRAREAVRTALAATEPAGVDDATSDSDVATDPARPVN